MSVLKRIAYFQGRRDEVPNQELARQLAASQDKDGIGVIAENLRHKEKRVRSDCLKVLYEIGYSKPELIADYVDDFLGLLDSQDNRMVWGGMIALAAIAEMRPEKIWARIDKVAETTQQGTVITKVWGVRVLARVAGANREYLPRIFPSLLAHLRTCIPRDVATHAESILPAVDERLRQEFLEVLESRQKEMTPAQRTRLSKITNKVALQKKQ